MKRVREGGTKGEGKGRGKKTERERQKGRREGPGTDARTVPGTGHWPHLRRREG